MAAPFGAAEYLSSTSHGIARSVRNAQVSMAGIVESVFRGEGGIVMLEAPTGTGKSIAYSLPAYLSGLRVVISTAKKTLQKQLIGKDLPHIAEKLGPTLSVIPSSALLKGKGNYGCELRKNELEENEHYQRWAAYERELFLEWFAASLTGDLADVPRPVPYQIEAALRVTECVRSSCPHAENNCGYVWAKDRAMNAKILVVNHALLAADLAMGGGKLFGPYDALVIDEAHQAPKFFRDAYSLRLHHKQPEAMRRLLDGSEYELPEVVDRIFGEIFQRIPQTSQTLPMSDAVRPYFEDLYEVIGRARQKMEGKGLLDDEPSFESGDFDVARAKSKLKAGATMVDKVKRLAQIALGRHVERDEEGQILSGGEVDYLVFVDTKGRGSVPEVVVTPLEIGPLIAPPLLGLKKVVITSATLSTNNDFSYMSREFGFHPKQLKDAVILPATFNYKAISCAYVSATSPDPSDRGDAYYDQQAAEIHELLTASKGGALVLCTSYDDMNKFHSTIRSNHLPLSYNMGLQNGPPEPLIEWFLKTPNPVLFGVKTFWEGVDLPGLVCRLIVIPRLPFPNYGDVLLKARKQQVADRLIEAGYEPNRASMQTWADFDLNEAIFDLKQGAGRLIRTETDMGVVAVLDKRAYSNTKGYSHKVRSALPMPTTSDKGKALAFLSGLANMYEEQQAKKEVGV